MSVKRRPAAMMPAEHIDLGPAAFRLAMSTPRAVRELEKVMRKGKSQEQLRAARQILELVLDMKAREIEERIEALEIRCPGNRR